MIGCNLPGNKTRAFFCGIIDELRISKVARYTTNFTPQATFKPDGDTLALYHFDEGAGDVLADASGNGHHGKIVNAKWVPGIVGLRSRTQPNTVAPTTLKPATKMEQGSDGWVSLFNGRDLTGWKPFRDREGLGPPWRVSDGCLLGEPQISSGRLGTTRSDFANFHLRIEAKITGGNAKGWTIIRASDDHTAPHYRMPIDHAEINMIANGKPGGSGFRVLQKGEPADLVTPGEWFVHEVIANDNEITVLFNGKHVITYKDNDRLTMSGAIEFSRSPNSTMQIRKVEIV